MPSNRTAVGRRIGARVASLVAAGTLVLAGAAGCASNPAAGLNGQVLVVDTRGHPLPGAVVLPDPETPRASDKGSDADAIKDGTTNQAGTVTVNLEDFYWSADGCFHLRVSHPGYDAVIMSVSRDLFPAQLRVELKTPAQN